MTTIDERIVQMLFDNKEFETNAAQSIKTLDSLNKSLDMTEASKSFTDLDRTTRGFTLAGIADGVGFISDRFSALGIIGVTTLQNITNSAVNAGKSLIKSLTIDPITTGFSEYETKINAIQTILTNTAAKGTTLEDVNRVLGELNEYSDQTIYNFAEMTKNIGTFTAAGVGLDTAATSIKGIANLAAGSGSSSQQAATAMYQLSQAISAGSLKLQDWNSVVNAGMGGELFQTALKDTAKQMGIFVDESIPFRESLKDGWITTDVLTKTLENFANDEALIQAATQVRTFTMLLDTMKESVQSGWAVSWEHIIGNKEESAELLTAISNAFNDMVGPAADARNAMLEFWNANGGRAAVIDGIRFAFEGLMSIISPIREAFRDVFPPIAQERLVELSERFRDLMSNFKIGEDTARNLRNTFEGIFSVFDFGIKLVSGLINGFTSLIRMFLPAGDGILGVAGKLGEMATAFNESITNIGLFESAVNGLSRIQVKFPDLSGFYEYLTGITSKLPSFETVVKAIRDGVGSFFEMMKKGLDNLGYTTFIDAIWSGLFASILLQINTFIKSLSGPVDAVTDVIGSFGSLTNAFKNVLDGVTSSLEAMQNNLKAGTLIKIAAAIGILAVAIIALSSVDPVNLIQALGIMTALFTELSLALYAFTLMDLKSLGGSITTLLGVAATITILVNSLQELASLDPQQVTSALGAMTVVLTQMVATIYALQKLINPVMVKNLGSVTTALVLMSVAIGLLSDSFIELGQMPFSDIIKGFLGLAAVVTTMVIAAKELQSVNGKLVSASAGLILMASGIKILTDAFGTLASLSLEELFVGLIGMGILLSELWLFLDGTDFKSLSIAKAASIILVAEAIGILSESVEIIGGMSLEGIVKGLIGIGGLLLEISIFTNSAGNPAGILASAAALTVISAALIALSGAMSVFSGFSWEGIAKSLVALGGALAIISVAMESMVFALPGAAAMAVVSGALVAFTPSMALLGSLSWEAIAKGLTALAGALTVLVVAGNALTPVVPTILALSAAFTLASAGFVGLGVGVEAAATGLSTLATIGADGATKIVDAFSTMAKGAARVVPDIATAIAEGIIAFAEAIASGAPKVADAILALLEMMVDILVEGIPLLVRGLGALIEAVLRAIGEYGPRIIAAAIELLVNFLNVLRDYIPIFAQAAVELVVAFVNALANALRNNTDAILSAIKNLLSSIIEFFLATLSELVRGIPIIGDNMSKAIDKARQDLARGFSQDQMASIGSNAMMGVQQGIASQNRSVGLEGRKVGDSGRQGVLSGLGEMFGFGQTAGLDFSSGLGSTTPNATQAGERITTGALGSIEYYQAEYARQGGAAGNSFSTNMLSTQTAAGNAGTSLAQSAATGISSGVSSLSDVGKTYGNNFVSGINSTAPAASTAGQNITNNALTGVKSNATQYGPQGTTNGNSFVNSLNSTSTNANTAGRNITVNALNGIASQNAAYTTQGTTSGGNFVSGVTAYNTNAYNAGVGLSNQAYSGVGVNNANYRPRGEANSYDYTRGISDNNTNAYNAGKTIATQADSGIYSQRTSFKTTGTESGQYFIDGFSSKGTTAGTAMNTTLYNTLYGYRSNYNSVGKTVGDYFVDGFATQETYAKSAATSMGNQVNAVLTSYKSSYTSVGKSSGTGWIDGLVSTLTAAVNQAKIWGTNILNAIKNTLGIRSPSREMAKLAVYSAEGFINGLIEMSPDANKTATGFAEGMLDAISATLSSVGDLISSDLNTEPTIRPVLEMDELRQGIQAANGMLEGLNGAPMEAKYARLSSIISGRGIEAEVDPKSLAPKEPSYTFTQNNYSPKALSRIDIYRQTRNQFAVMKGLAEAT